jgi:hypothetical protein
MTTARTAPRTLAIAIAVYEEGGNVEASAEREKERRD